MSQTSYPKRFINRHKKGGKYKEAEKPKATIVIPHLKTTSESIKQILQSVDIRTTFTPNTTLRKILVQPKDRIPNEKKNGVVHQIACDDCNMTYMYIGQTKRTLLDRVKVHKNALTSGYPINSAIAEHAMMENIEWKF